MQIPDQIAAAFPKRPVESHKYSVGVVTVVGGSIRYTHAPVIAGLGARVGGAGLVQLVVPEVSRIAAGALVPEATFTKLTPDCVPPRADVSVIGMGLGSTPNAEMLVSRLLSGSAGRFVLDADALTVLANWYAQKAGTLPVTEGQTVVLTPHAGEAARLLACSAEDVQHDRMAAVRQIEPAAPVDDRPVETPAKAPASVPESSSFTRFQSICPSERCMKKPTSDMPKMTKTEVPTACSGVHPNTNRPAVMGPPPVTPSSPDMTPPSNP